MPPMRLDWEYMDPEDGDKILDIIHTYFRAKRAKILVEIKLAQAQEKDWNGAGNFCYAGSDFHHTASHLGRTTDGE